MQLTKDYKQTEVGVIPDDWNLMGLGDFSDIETGLSKPKIIFGAGCPVVMVQNLYEGSAINFNGLRRVVTTHDEIQRYRLKRGDVLIGNASVKRDGIGYANIFNGAPEEVIFAKYAYRASNLKNVNSQYLLQSLRARYCRQWIISNSQTGTLTNLNKTAASAIPIALPPTKDEQEAIAQALSDADAWIESLEQLIAKKRRIKEGASQALLTGKQRLSGFSGEWEVKTLGEVADFFKGKGLPKSSLQVGGEKQCIHYGELFTFYQDTIKHVRSRTNDSEGAFYSKCNDVLMPTSDVTPRGLAKASCLFEDGIILGGDILVIRSDQEKIMGSFLSSLIRFEETQILQLVTGSTVFHLYGSDMKNFTFSMPTKAEQTAIAEILSNMDTELDALEAKLSKARQIKQGMMQELLTGKTRLVTPASNG